MSLVFIHIYSCVYPRQGISNKRHFSLLCTLEEGGTPETLFLLKDVLYLLFCVAAIEQIFPFDF